MDRVEFTEVELTDGQLEQISGGFDHDDHPHQSDHGEYEHHPHHHHGHWGWWHHKRFWFWDD